MEFEGKITVLGKVETVGQNNLAKQNFILEEDNDKEYKNSICIDVFGDKVDTMMKSLKVGDKVRVMLNTRSKEYNGRYFNSISAWKIDKVGGNAPADDSDLPF